MIEVGEFVTVKVIVTELPETTTPGGVNVTTGGSVTEIVTELQPVFPEASVAQTMKVWLPLVRLVYVTPELHEAAAAESSLHVVGKPEGDVLKASVTELPVVLPITGCVMTTSGGGPPVLNVTDAQPVPATLVAHTVIVCEPSASPANVIEVAHVAAAPLSSTQVVAVGELVAVKFSVAELPERLVPATGEVIVTIGAWATVMVADEQPVFPARSVAQTVNV